jgi:hypothetical protein
MAEVHQPHHLKHTETQDKSAPLIDSSIHINQNNRKDLFREIQQPHQLKHTETHDTSAPVIDSDVHIHKTAKLRLKENVNWAKEKLVENVGYAKEKIAENMEYAKEKIASNVGIAKEGLKDSAHNAKEKVVENVEHAKEGLKENAEVAKEKLAHNATVAKVKLSNMQSPNGIPVPPPSEPAKPLLPPQPTDKPHHEQAFTEKIVNQEAKLHHPTTNVKGQIPVAPENPPIETPQEHQKSFTKQIGKAKLHKGDVPRPPENTYTNPPTQPHETAFTEQIVQKESKVAKAVPGEMSSQQRNPITLE